MSRSHSKSGHDKQLLHLVFGGRVKDPKGHEFEDLNRIDFVGLFPSYAEAVKAWRGASQAHVDDALTKYVVVHLHRLLEPDEAEGGQQPSAAQRDREDGR